MPSNPTTTTSLSSKPAVVGRQKKWTNTNSDERCLKDVNNPVSRFLYVLSLKTGFYSIEETDRRISLVIFCFLMIVSTIMFYVFVQGVRDGFQQAVASTTVTDTDSSL